jgi:hypothetical protein
MIFPMRAYSERDKIGIFKVLKHGEAGVAREYSIDGRAAFAGKICMYVHLLERKISDEPQNADFSITVENADRAIEDHNKWRAAHSTVTLPCPWKLLISVKAAEGGGIQPMPPEGVADAPKVGYLQEMKFEKLALLVFP